MFFISDIGCLAEDLKIRKKEVMFTYLLHNCFKFYFHIFTRA